MYLRTLGTYSLLLLLSVLTACTQVELEPSSGFVPGNTPIADNINPDEYATGPAQPSIVAEQIATPVPPTAPATLEPPAATLEPSATPTDMPSDLSLHATNVQLYPAPDIYSGDRVTFQVLPFVPEGIAVRNVMVDIYVDNVLVNQDTLRGRNWAGQAEGIFSWVWDTTGFSGEHFVRMEIDAANTIVEGDESIENNVIEFPVQVQSAGLIPLEERDANWITSESECCKVHVLTRTSAYRDLPDLLLQVDEAVNDASRILGVQPERKIDIFFVERTIGQGGFAGSNIVATYIDRQYAGGGLHELLVHEAVHVLDRQFAPQRIQFLAEGIAVWASGGHYHPENLQERAAALLILNEFLPLSTIINNFYQVQHEVGYLEAGAFVDYLISTYGWTTFRDFYAETSADDGQDNVQAINVNAEAAFGRSLQTLEADWIASLARISPSDEVVADLETTIRYYDTMRRYQQEYDPTAYFLTAWLPPPHDVVATGNPADFMRRPESVQHVAIEVMLRAADKAAIAGDYRAANVLLDSVTHVLNDDGAFADPLGASYLRIVQTATNFGYEVQDIHLQGTSALALVTTASGYHLSELNLEQRFTDWVLLD